MFLLKLSILMHSWYIQHATVVYTRLYWPLHYAYTVRSEVIQLQREITEHLNDGRRGEKLRSGIHVTIVGAPNAGKSSLLNILCKQKLKTQRHFVHWFVYTCRPAPCCNSVSLCRHYQGFIGVHSGHLWLSNHLKVLHEIIILLRI